MSQTWRQRLATRRLELGLEGKDYDYLKEYIEHYCQKSDEEAKKLTNDEMLKTVDQVINSMADPEFDRFTSGVIADVSRKLGRDDIAQRIELKQKSKMVSFKEITKSEKPIPA